MVSSVAVIGAGVMGASIAAHVANAGVPVMLLDIVQPGAASRNAVAEGAIERLKKMDPAPLMSARAARLITPGNIEDDLAQLGGCDWIIEAVVERLEVKQDLYRRLETVCKPGAVISSNTSTIPLRELTAGLPQHFAARFCITHFFNPPRYMRLLEMVGAESETFAALRAFVDERLGKTAVPCKDTPGFIANRIGAYWIQCALVLAQELGLEVEEADAVLGKPLGFPSTGIFGLLDLVGIDLAPQVNASMGRLLPPGDAFHAMNRDAHVIEKLIAEGYTGNKGKGGFYRRGTDAAGKREKLALDLPRAVQGDLAWRPAVKPELPLLKEARKDLKRLLDAESKYGRYAWGVLGRVLAYAASLVPEIADDIADIDTAMRLGYTWKYGPFELIDRLGAEWVAARLGALRVAVPPLLKLVGNGTFYQAQGAELRQFAPDGTYRPIRRAPGILLLDDIKRAAGKPLIGNKNASVWDLGDGVLCFEIHAELRGSMLNMLDGDILGVLEKALLLTAQNHKALVLYNDDLREAPHKTNFSTGANIGMVQMMANIRLWSKIENAIKDGQKLLLTMRYAPFPVVAAPAGRALGGGCELLLHCSAVQAYAESYIGLVEAGVGVVPAWGGCATMLTRWQYDKRSPKGPMPAVAKVFEIISTATVSRSAHQAKELKFLSERDGITMNRDRLLADAKAKALALAADYRKPEPLPLRLPGPSGLIALRMAVDGFYKRGLALDHDVTVSTALAEVLSGGGNDYLDELSETDVMALERTKFMALIRTRESQARIKSIIDTGKPLRN
ncbi:MAG TPA: 3-hydroxyacyl-CoA dehydrogenase NAD-binding domain-containing protein [Acidocella sp.]|jgi:3-hydroxyacyl-CoA dehydrogenase|uniref:3-hydroxyacyl-CoA dehydrogenase/enoyl-CoA hydratase family protein n=1 Tax=Acidocella sp. TaxID=50710 RepID=UPI002BF08CD9|nr:3-hydroxyacyl-CoA dehydrogenase NAD-binding domain-containing protein [Acidocella sp.]HVE20506.1 3-hydroxyacyl-CoA dehydrogenase NAD-binding domain-containing protein [Acidocella sp.]